MHNQYSQMTPEEKERFCQSVFEAWIFPDKSLVVAITGENEFPPPCLILDLVKTENFVKTVAENLKNEKCVSVKKKYWRI